MHQLGFTCAGIQFKAACAQGHLPLAVLQQRHSHLVYHTSSIIGLA